MEIKPEFIFIGILILVPAQWFLSPSDTGHLKFHLNSLLFSIKQYIPEFLIPSSSKKDEKAAESKDMEAEMDFNEHGSYGMGQYIRQRAPNVQYRVGDVIYHKTMEYRAVIIGWDPQARAPEEYLKQAHKENTHFATQPHYAVVIDTRDRLTPQLSYVVQENIQLDKGIIWHPILEKFFDGYDEIRKKYIMRPIYKKSYPDD